MPLLAPASINTNVHVGSVGQVSGRTGFSPLPLQSWRLVASNDYPAIAVASGNGGNLGVDTAPKLIRISTSTDKKASLSWASSSSIEIMHHWEYPFDLDDAFPVVFHATAKMGGATDTPVLTIGYFEGIGDSTAGGNTVAVTATLADMTRIIAAADIGAYPNAASIIITPGAHTTDALVITETWMTYTKKRGY